MYKSWDLRVHFSSLTQWSGVFFLVKIFVFIFFSGKKEECINTTLLLKPIDTHIYTLQSNSKQFEILLPFCLLFVVLRIKSAASSKQRQPRGRRHFHSVFFPVKHATTNKVIFRLLKQFILSKVRNWITGIKKIIVRFIKISKFYYNFLKLFYKENYYNLPIFKVKILFLAISYYKIST